MSVKSFLFKIIRVQNFSKMNELDDLLKEAIWLMPVPIKKITVKNFYKRNKDKENFADLWDKKKRDHLAYWAKYNLEKKFASKIIWQKTKKGFTIVRIDDMQNPCYIYTSEEKIKSFILSVALSLNCEKPNLDNININKGSIRLFYFR